MGQTNKVALQWFSKITYLDNLGLIHGITLMKQWPRKVIPSLKFNENLRLRVRGTIIWK